MDMLKYEKKYWNSGIKFIAGIDEAGRGPLAGPVVAASVIFKKNTKIDDIKDSKKISPKKREKLYLLIFEKALSVGIGVVNEDVIDRINILQATYLAMRKSIGNLNIVPEQILIDGPSSNIKQIKAEHIIDGDNRSQSIAAASIIAKVYRDEIMNQYDKIMPEYYLSKNKGYGTKIHIEQLKLIKSSPIHRKSFKIVKKNMPSFNFIYNNYGFNILSLHIVGINYIKRKYEIIDKNLIINNLQIDLIVSKNEKMIFNKIIYKNELSKIDLTNRNVYLSSIQNYLCEKDIKSDFDFIVNLVEFFKNKKPIISTFNFE